MQGHLGQERERKRRTNRRLGKVLQGKPRHTAQEATKHHGKSHPLESGQVNFITAGHLANGLRVGLLRKPIQLCGARGGGHLSEMPPALRENAVRLDRGKAGLKTKVACKTHPQALTKPGHSPCGNSAALFVKRASVLAVSPKTVWHVKDMTCFQGMSLLQFTSSSCLARTC